MRDKLGDQWLGFSEDRLAGLLTRAGLADVRVMLGARHTNDPFVVLLAVGTKAEGARLRPDGKRRKAKRG